MILLDLKKSIARVPCAGIVRFRLRPLSDIESTRRVDTCSWQVYKESLQYSRSRKFDLTRVRFATEQSFDSSLAPNKGEAKVEENLPNFVTFMLSLFANAVWLSFQYHRTYEAA